MTEKHEHHQQEHHQPEHHHHPHNPEVHIQIDRVHYTVHKHRMTGLELRHVPQVSIGPDRDLFEVVPGGTDRKIPDHEEVEICDGKRFLVKIYLAIPL